MVVFTIWIKLATVAAVQCPHDANARKHRRTARRRDHDQRFHCSLSLRDLMLGFREFGDVIAGVLQCDELATARQRDRFIEPSLPTAISHWRVAAADVSMKCLFGLDREADQYFE
jgi:hypothetical protein